MNICEVCHKNEASGAWKFLGDDYSEQYLLPEGKHDETTIFVCSECLNIFDAGHQLSFTHNGIEYSAKNRSIYFSDPSYYDFGVMKNDDIGMPAHVMMRTMPNGGNIVSGFLAGTQECALFLAAPELLEACEEMLTAFGDYQEHFSMQKNMALAGARLALKEYRTLCEKYEEEHEL